MSEDGTHRLCVALYARPPKPHDYLGGASAVMLHDAATRIAILTDERDRALDHTVRLFTEIGELTAERDALRAELATRTAGLDVIVDAVKSLLLADGKLNIWCMATHGHIPFGWAEYMNALTCLRVALAAVEVPHDTE